MIARPLYALLVVSSLAELGGCNALLKKKDPDAAPSAAPLAAQPPPATVIAPSVPELVASAAVAPTAVDENAVPTPQDFEDEAFEKVTAKNFRAEFATLKTAIGK